MAVLAVGGFLVLLDDTVTTVADRDSNDFADKPTPPVAGSWELRATEQRPVYTASHCEGLPTK